MIWLIAPAAAIAGYFFLKSKGEAQSSEESPSYDLNAYPQSETPTAFAPDPEAMTSVVQALPYIQAQVKASVPTAIAKPKLTMIGRLPFTTTALTAAAQRSRAIK